MPQTAVGELATVPFRDRIGRVSGEAWHNLAGFAGSWGRADRATANNTNNSQSGRGSNGVGLWAAAGWGYGQQRGGLWARLFASRRGVGLSALFVGP